MEEVVQRKYISNPRTSDVWVCQLTHLAVRRESYKMAMVQEKRCSSSTNTQMHTFMPPPRGLNVFLMEQEAFVFFCFVFAVLEIFNAVGLNHQYFRFHYIEHNQFS